MLRIADGQLQILPAGATLLVSLDGDYDFILQISAI